MATKKSATKATSKAEQAVVVTTAHRGVFFGYAKNVDAEVIELRAARLCSYWSKAMKGFMGLASGGPDSECRIGPPANIKLRNITSVVAVTPDAVVKWEAAPWNA